MIDPESTNTFSKLRVLCSKREEIFAIWLASGLRSGFSPLAPGTCGSAALLLIFIALETIIGPTSMIIRVGITLFLILIGLWSTSLALKVSQSKDPGWIVIDEWAGMALTLIPLQSNFINYFLAFIAFRVLDACKPFPINVFERIKGSVGVMADDLCAGVIGGALVWLSIRYCMRFW